MCHEEDESQPLSSGAVPSKRDPGRGTCPQKQARAALSDGSDLYGGWTYLGGGGGKVGKVGKVGKEGRGPMEGCWPGNRDAWREVRLDNNKSKSTFEHLLSTRPCASAFTGIISCLTSFL